MTNNCAATGGDFKVVVYTERLILRPWQESDAECLYEYAKDPLVGPSAGWVPHTSIENSREIIRDILSDDGTYAVCLKVDGKPIGSISLFKPTQISIELEPSDMEIGYWLATPFWGQGIIPEAINRLLEYAFLTLGCTTVWCGYFEGNEKSKRCMEKCGFKYHHTEENKYYSQINEFHALCYARLSKEEWLKTR